MNSGFLKDEFIKKFYFNKLYIYWMMMMMMKKKGGNKPNKPKKFLMKIRVKMIKIRV